MKARGILVSLVGMALAWTLRARSGQPSAQIQRGKYLVESVAMCGDGHKPRGKVAPWVAVTIQARGTNPRLGRQNPENRGSAWMGRQRRDQVPDDGPRVQRSSCASAYAAIPAHPGRSDSRGRLLRSLTPEQKIEPDEQIASRPQRVICFFMGGGDGAEVCPFRDFR